MALLPPFSLTSKPNTRQYGVLEELIEDHLALFETERICQINFTNLEFGPAGRPALYLNPSLPEEFYFLLEDLYATLCANGARFKERNYNGPHDQRAQHEKPLWPLARGLDGETLAMLVARAQELLPMPVQCRPLSIDFFEKGREGQWCSRRLFAFNGRRLNSHAELALTGK